jgi:A/G-specific adenine glycosylase
VILSAVVDALRQFYGRLPDPPTDPFAYFVWEVLSTESMPAKRDAAYGAFKKIPALTPDAMQRAPQAKITAAIALVGAYRDQRLDALHIGIDRFRRIPTLADQIRGPLPAARRALRHFPNLSEDGARRMLLFAGNHAVVPVDARIERVATRVGYVSGAIGGKRRARAIQRSLTRDLGGDLDALRRAVLYFSHHGSLTCVEREPHCGVCPIAGACPYQLSGPGPP